MPWNKMIASISIVFSLLYSYAFSGAQGTGYLEAGLFTNYTNSTRKNDFIVEAISPVWNKNFYLTDSLQTGSLFQVPEHKWQTSQGTFYKYGWGHCSSHMASNSLIWDTLGYALYKISCTYYYQTFTVINYFYLDWRDDRFPGVFYSSNDFEINFNDTTLEDRFS